MRGRVWSGFIWFTLGSCGRICEHSRELSGCMWGREFIIKLSNYNILKMDCTPCILLLIYAVALLIEWRLLLLYILLKCYTGFIINHPLSCFLPPAFHPLLWNYAQSTTQFGPHNWLCIPCLWLICKYNWQLQTWGSTFHTNAYNWMLSIMANEMKSGVCSQWTY